MVSDNKWGFWFNIYKYIHKIKEIKSLVLGDHEKVYLFNMSLFY